MMAAIFATLALAFVFAWFHQRGIGLMFLALCFVLALGLFLWEIYSPDYGFRMPWLQAELALPSQHGGEA
jgi:hypothetical protein